MADVKISQLPSATTPLAGTEVLPIVQGGVTSKVSAADMTAGRAVSMSSATVSTGNLTFGSTAQRITGDFSNATIANRLSFQNSVTNGSSNIQAIPNGTSLVSGILAFSNSDPSNTSFAGFQSVGPEARVTGGITGTGSYPYMTFFTGGSERVRVDTSGNVGIGTNAPRVVSGYTSVGINATTGGLVDLFASGTRLATFGADGTAAIIGSITSIPFVFNTGGSERARIDSSGNLLVGTTSGGGEKLNVASAGNAFVSKTTGAAASNFAGAFWHADTIGNNQFLLFGTEGTFTVRGSITYNRAGGLTAYNTTSDYRAKDIIGPLTDSGAVIDSTPVYMGKMKGATQERPMFIAHETPSYAHTGEKDGVDADGKPVYQQMDASALVPVMWAEIQSLRQRLAAAGI